jgi:hypothetical protein
MRTTLTIDDDVLVALRSRAELENRAIGDALPELARSALRGPVAVTWRNGLPILPRPHLGPAVTLDIVNALRDDEF